MKIKELPFQKNLLAIVEAKHRPDIKFTKELSQVLDLTEDAVYRRKRLEIPLSFDEGMQLITHYKIDPSFITNEAFHNKVLPFKFVGFGSNAENPTDVSEYLVETFNWLNHIKSGKNGKMYYFAKDIPIFSLFQQPTLGRFKLFTWLKTLKNLPDFKDTKFLPNIIPQELFDRCAQVSKLYYEIPSTEIWNTETINSIIMQVQYYQRGNFFENHSDILAIKDELMVIIKQFEQQCDSKHKYHQGTAQPHASYELFQNEISIMDNVMLGETKDTRFSLIILNGMEYVYSYDTGFGQGNIEHFKTVSKKSKVILESEIDRRNFFDIMYEKIERLQ